MKITLMGVPFEFCYTVSAQMEIAEKLGGIDKLKDAFSGTPEQMQDNILMIAAAMLQGGEKRERLRCKLYGEEYKGNRAMTKEELKSVVVTAADLKALTNAVLQAMQDGDKVNVELAPTKKGKATG